MNFLDQVSPILLTYDEAPNIARSLSKLAWARRVLVVDSFSTDDTREICGRFPNVTVVRRAFDTHAAQWNFALEQAPEAAAWVLALDADHVLSDAFIEELAALRPEDDVSGYLCRYSYVVNGRRLRSGVYPPKVALFRRDRGRFIQDGHTQREVIDGRCGSLSAPILHDDRKPFERWVASQRAYARLESETLRRRLQDGGRLRVRDWLRARTPFAPLAMGLYCLFVRGAAFEGAAGWCYALQRIAAEALISGMFFDAEVRASAGVRAPEESSE